MSNDYCAVKGGGLKLKGNKKGLLRMGSKKNKNKIGNILLEKDEDCIAHGGWRKIVDEIELRGGISISIECGRRSGCYLSALDNGKITVGVIHKNGEGPRPEEIFALVKTPDESKFSLKTGYGKYVGVDSDGELVATAEAIGAREQFQAVFQEGRSALQAICNPLFMSIIPNKEGRVFVASRQVKEDEIVIIRTDAEKASPVDWKPANDRKGAHECETAYVKMYQHSKVDLKGRHIPVNLNDVRAVKRAQTDGDLHELLLDRRSKMKSDRYC